jgi:hypothetical protein
VPSGTTRDLEVIARAPGSNTLWAGGLFEMLKSTDGGLTWRSQKSTMPALEIFVFGIGAADESTVWAVNGGNMGIMKTTTGGD